MTNLASDCQKRLFIIKMVTAGGLFAYVNFALNQLQYCEKKNYRPVVWFGKRSVDNTPNPYYQQEYGENTWDYFFEPVAGLTYADVEARLEQPDGTFPKQNFSELSLDQLWHMHENDPESIFPYPHGIFCDKAEFDNEWYSKQRRKAHELIEKYVHVKPHIIAKVDNFYQSNFAGNLVIGVHIRGTDKGSARSAPRLMRIVKPASYFKYIDEYTEKNGDCKIFVATDQEQFLDEMRQRYGDRILSYEAMRTRSTVSAFQVQEGNNYMKGEEVLIDCLLLTL